MSDASQQLILGDWTVRCRDRVPLSDPPRTSRIPGYRDYAVGADAALASNQRDVSHTKITRHDALNQQRVSGPDCGEHAPAGRRKTQATKRTQNLAREFTSRRDCLGNGIVLPHQETFF